MLLRKLSALALALVASAPTLVLVPSEASAREQFYDSVVGARFNERFLNQYDVESRNYTGFVSMREKQTKFPYINRTGYFNLYNRFTKAGCWGRAKMNYHMGTGTLKTTLYFDATLPRSPQKCPKTGSIETYTMYVPLDDIPQ